MEKQWRSSLNDGWNTLHAALSPLRECDADDIQLELYKYSFNFAELAAADHLIDEFSRRTDTDSLDYRFSRELISRWLATGLRALDENVRSYSTTEQCLSESDTTVHP